MEGVGDLPDTQQHTDRDPWPGVSPSLPGTDDGGNVQPTDVATHDGAILSGSNPGVPGGGSGPDAGADVAGRRPRARAVPKESGPLQRPVPVVSPGERKTRDRVPGVSGADIAQASVNAIQKAETGEWWRTVAWQADHQHWTVPSRTTAGAFYIVKRRGSRAKGRWWDIFKCNCPTESVGRRICWHKAAVYIRLIRGRTQGGQGEQA